MDIDENDPEFIEYKRECAERREKIFREISIKHNLDYEYVKNELEKGPFHDSPIWKLLDESQ